MRTLALIIGAIVLLFSFDGRADCLATPAGLVSWWPGDSSAADIAATNHGTLQGGATATAAGRVGNAFTFDGTNAFVQIPDSPALRPTNFTIETWVKVDAMNSPSSTANAGVQFFVFKQNTRTSTFEGFWLGKSRSTGTDHFLFGVSSATGTFVPARSGIMQTGVWYHLAAVRGSNFIQLYTNGQMAAQATVNFPQDYGNYPLYFGTSGQPSYDAKMKGQLDEVTLYNRALSASEIALIYAAGAAGKCKEFAIQQQPRSVTNHPGSTVNFSVQASGSGPLTYQWYFNGSPLAGSLRISGTNTPTLQIAGILTNDAGNYSMRVAGPSGSLTSTVATLTVAAPAFLVNVDFHGISPSPKTGGAAIGQSANDYWNYYLGAGNGHTDGTWALLKKADSVDTAIGMSLPGAAGTWGTGSLDPMYDTYVYPYFSQSCNLTITNLPPGAYLIYVYSPDGVFNLTAAAKNYGTKTCYEYPIINPPVWEEGRQYVQFRDVFVTNAAQSLVLNVQSGVGGFALISGVQIASDLKPWLVQQPTNVTLYAGSTLQFQAEATGTPPLSYQWYFQGVPLTNDARTTGANSNVLSIENVATNDAGNYWVQVSNPYGAATSSIATATILPNDCALSTGLLAWWTGNGLTSDSAGTNVVIQMNGVTYATGKVSECFAFDGASSKIVIAESSPLNVGMGGGFTIECWINPSDTRTAQPIVEWNNLDYTPTGAHLWISAFGLGDIAANLIDTGGGYRLFSSPAGLVRSNTFQHIALTYDKATGVGILYYNGVPVGSQNLGIFTPQTSFPLYLGNRPQGGYCYKGLMDEVGIFDRPLSASEIRNIYNAQAVGKCNMPPKILAESGDSTNVVGQAANLTAVVAGSAPLIYHWYFNDSLLSDDERVTGTSSSRLTIRQLQFNDAGNYWFVVSNSSGSLTSTLVRLEVREPVCSSILSGLVSWWQGESNGYDSFNTNTAVIQNTAGFGIGQVGQAFQFNGVDDRVIVAPSGGLNVGTNSSFSIECWINPTDVTKPYPILEWNPNNGSSFNLGVHLWISQASGSGSGPGCIFANVRDTTVGDHYLSSAPGIVISNVFQHVALVYDRATGIAKLYYNGEIVGSKNIGVFTPETTYPFYIGYRSTTFAWPTTSFSGGIDEIAVYQRALSTTEIQNIYKASSLGRCPLAPTFIQPFPSEIFVLRSNEVRLLAAIQGSQPMNLQWYFDGQPIADSEHVTGATSNLLLIRTVQDNDMGNYSIVASNSVGVSTSSVAQLMVGVYPAITEMPVSQTNATGRAVTFSTEATGTEPLSYQWYQNTTALIDDARRSGTTTSTLTISNLLTSDAGNYTLRVTNFFGSATSAVATLTVLIPPSLTLQPVGYSVPVGMPVTMRGTASGSAPLRYQWTLNGNPVLNATNTSLTISNLVLTDFGDYQLIVTNGGGAVTSAVASLTRGTVAIWGTIGQAASFPIWPTAGLSNVIQIAAGSSYSLALRQDGTVYYWGSNSQVSNTLPNLTGVVGLAAGPNHALALLSNGTVRAWGLNTIGQTIVPATLSNVIAVAAGAAHSAALRADGTVVMWGGNPLDAQTNMPPGLMKVTGIDAGGSQTFALREDGKLIAWGGRTSYPVPLDLKNVRSFSVAPGPGVLDLAVSSNGLVRAWGSVVNYANFPTNLNGIIAVEAVGTTDNNIGAALAVRSNRTVVGWGGGSSTMSLITNVPAAISNVVSLAGGTSHALALVDNNGTPLIINPPIGGTFYSGRDLVLKAKAVGTMPLSLQWLKNGNPIPGANEETLVLTYIQFTDNGSYQLVASNALGVASSVAVPVTVVDRAPVFMSQVQSRFAYYGSPFAVGASVIGSGPIDLTWLQNGVPTYFGTNDLVFDRALPQHGGSYQLIVSNPFGSITSAVAQITFSRIASWGYGPSLTNAPVDLGGVLGVASGYSHALAIRANGTVAAWDMSGSQTNVPADLSNVVAVAGGNNFSVALKDDGTVVAWGQNPSGETNVPPGLNNVTAIAAGASHALALRTDGTVTAWGLNSFGRTNVPTGLSNVVAIAAGSTFSAALRKDGKIFSWGSSITIPNGTNIIAIAAGYGNSLAVLQADGRVFSYITSLVGGPATLVAISNAVAVSLGGGYRGTTHGFALKSDGTLEGWGNSNDYNQLNWPGELTSVIAISAGSGSTLAYLNDRSPYVATQPLNRHAVSGSSPVLAAASVGRPTLSYQWRFNGADIPGATGATLTLTNVTRAARGNYSTLVWNDLGSTTTREAGVDVPGPVRLRDSGSSAAGGLSFVATDGAGNALTVDDLAWLEVQVSTNLSNWQILSNALMFTNGNLQLLDGQQANHATRFYRLIER